MTTKQIDLTKVSKENLVRVLNKYFQVELEYILLDLYHKILYDMVTLDDIEDIALKHNIRDLSEKYKLVIDQLEDE